MATPEEDTKRRRQITVRQWSSVLDFKSGMRNFPRPDDSTSERVFCRILQDFQRTITPT
jgi:hypothetical protein